MTDQLTTDVLIVGAGPTGLMAANQLMRFGIDFIIVDLKSEPTRESRAIAVTARSLEIYQQMGLAKTAIAQGKRMTSFNLYSGGKRKANVRVGEIGKGLSEFSYLLAFEQSKNETLLSENLVNHGHTVHWNHEFIKLTEHEEQINALIRHNGKEIEITAQYVIGCEGAKSPIRHQLNFSFKGGTYEQKFFVADAVLNWELGDDQLIVSPGSENFCAFLPLTGDRCHRIIGTLPKSFSDQEDVEFKDIEGVVAKTIGIPLKFETVNWFSIYKLHHRAVDHFKQGRAFLAGDSAHIHSPAGGQGMNTGLQDAYNLCWKLALVIKGQAKATLLNTYNEERLPFARWLLKFTDRGFTLMTSTNWFIKILRKYVALVIAGWVLKNAKIKPRIFRVISQIGYSYKRSSLSKSITRQHLKFKAGDRLPFVADDSIYPLFTEPSFHLLYIGDKKLSDEEANRMTNVFPFPIRLVEQSLTSKWQMLGVKAELFILVRPDNYMAAIYDQFDEDKVNSYLSKYFTAG